MYKVTFRKKKLINILLLFSGMIFLLILFILTKLDIFINFRNGDIQNFIYELVSLNITISTFAIGFSLFQYQFSPFGKFLNSIPIRLTLLHISLLVIALCPLFFLFTESKVIANVSLLSISIICASLFYLSTEAKREILPQTILQKQIDSVKLNHFIEEYIDQIKGSVIPIKDMDEEFFKDMPPHEWDYVLLPNLAFKSPLNTLISLLVTSIEQKDITLFEEIIEKVLIIEEYIDEYISSKNLDDDFRSEIINAINNYLKNIFLEIVNIINSIDDSYLYSEIFVNNICSYLNNEDKNDIRYKLKLSKGALLVAKKQFDKKIPDTSRMLITAIRQLVFKNLKKEYLHNEEYVLSSLVEHIKEIGTYAISQKETDFLYKSMESLCWLGCSAVKFNNIIVGKECLRSLVHLGRVAKKEDLECFWDHCDKTPHEHAIEYLYWITSWINNLDNKSFNLWSNQCIMALGRLTGNKYTISLKNKKIEITETNEAYEETRMTLEANSFMSRTYNYADKNLIKDRAF
jgi:hypothetical protein